MVKKRFYCKAKKNSIDILCINNGTKLVNRRTLSALAKPNIIQITHLTARFNQHAIFKVFLMTVYNP